MKIKNLNAMASEDVGGRQHRKMIRAAWDVILSLRIIIIISFFFFPVLARAQKVTYIYTDPQGTALAEADKQGAVIATYDYTPYGKTSMGASADGPGYTGHVNDEDTGLIYMQARYYDPDVSRFISTDPQYFSDGDPFKFNRFGYASNSPIVNTDPDGRDDSPWYQRLANGVKRFLNSRGAQAALRGMEEGAAAEAGGEGAENPGEAFVAMEQYEAQFEQAEARAQQQAQQQSSSEGSNVGGVQVGNTPTQARQDLEDAGSPGTPIQNPSGTETGTLHTMPDKKMDIRVMDGNDRNQPRIVTTRTGNPKQPVDPKTGQNLGNIPKVEQRQASHIPLNQESDK
jgi:RHS repeat-associated protein